MAVVQIPNLPAAIALSGSEQLEAVQAGVSVRLTVAQISQAINQPAAPNLSLQFNSNGVFGGSAGITTNGLARITLGAQQTSQGSLVLANTAAGAWPVTLQSSNSATAAWTMTLPPAVAAGNGFILTSNTSGVTSWTNPTAIGIDLDVGTTAITNGTAGRVLFQGAGDVLQQSANLFWDNANNQLDLAAGTATIPALSTVSDSNTGVFFPAADTVAVSTGGSEWVRITSAGTVNIKGLGTAGSSQAVSFSGSAPINTLVVDSLGSLLVGAPAFSSSVSTGTAAIGGIGIYPFSNNAGATNTTVLSSLNIESATAWTGNSGAGGLVYYALASTPKMVNSGSGGTANHRVVGGYFGPTIQSSGASASVSMTGCAGEVARYSASDLAPGLFVLAGSFFASHATTLPSTTTTTQLTGVVTNSFNDSGVVSGQEGQRANVRVGAVAGAGVTSVTTLSSFRSNTYLIGAATGNTATVTNAYGVNLAGPTVAATGTVTNYYGYFLGAATVTGTLTNRWGVYIDDSVAGNYFAGNVGIGTTSIGAKFDILVSIPAGGSSGARLTGGSLTSLWQLTGSAYSYNGVGANEVLFYGAGGPLSLLADGQPIKFCSGGERMRITSAGAVNIVGGGSAGSPAVSFSGSAPINSLVVRASDGFVGLGTSNPGAALDINSTDLARVARIGDYLGTGSLSIPAFEAMGSRLDANQTFQGRIGLSFRRTDGTAIASGTFLGMTAFGGQFGTGTTYSAANLLYSASIKGVAEGSFTSASAMPTAITFSTGSVGEDLTSPNTSYGTERMRITSAGAVNIVGGGSAGSPAVSFNGGAPSNSLVVDSAGNVGIGLSPAGNGLLELKAGTATVAPLKLTSGTNLTNAVAGCVEYDGSVFYSSVAASTRGALPSEQIVVLGTAYTLTSQTAAQRLFNATANGAVTLPVGTYQFECVFSLSSMSASSGSFGFALGTGTAVIGSQGWYALAQKGTATLSTATAEQVTYNTAANTALATASTNTVGFAVIRGFFRVTTAGTVIPQVSLGVAAAAVVGAQSYFIVSPVSAVNAAATNITVGNWS